MSAQIEYTTYKYDGICIIIYNHNVYNTLIVQKSLYLKTLVQGQSSMYVHPVPVHVAFVLKESNLNVDFNNININIARIAIAIGCLHMELAIQAYYMSVMSFLSLSINRWLLRLH